MSTSDPTPLEQASGPSPLDLLQRNRALLIGLGVALIALMTVLAYAPSLRGGFLWDDDYHVTSNRLLRSGWGLQRIWFGIMPSPKAYPLPQYYPLTHTTFWIEYQIWGRNALGYRATNVALHVANALLIWLLLRKLTVPGAFAAAAIFALHPLNVETVAWISERKNVLCGFFFFSSIYVYLRYAGVIAAPEHSSEYFALPKERERVWGLALALFVFALLSKTVAGSMPAVVLLVIWWKRGRIRWDDVTPLLPFFALSIGAAALTSFMERVRVGAVGPEWDHGLVERVVIAGRAFWFYLGKLVYPHPLIFNYERWDPHDARPLLWLYPLSALALLVLLIVYRNRLGRGPAAAMLFYAGTLFPALGFINVLPHRYSFVADHFAYLSLIGPIALAVALAVRACERYLPRDASAAGAPAAAASAVLLVFFLLTLMHGRVFASPARLWKDVLEKRDKQSWFAANNYGLYLLERRDVEAAEAWFDHTLKLKSDHPEAHFNLGLIAESRGQHEEAVRLYLKSLELRPEYALPLARLGQLAQARGDWEEAERYLRRVIEINPNDDHAHVVLGLFLEGRGKYEEAIDQYQAAADLNPESATPYVQTGNALLKMGRGQDAMVQWLQAVRIEKDNPTVANNVGALFADSGYYEEARAQFQLALSINPRMVDAYTNLGIVSAFQGKAGEARQLFYAALEIDPNNARARDKLAALEAGRLKPPATAPATMPATQSAP